MKLKTLKDLEFEKLGCDCRDIIRKEATKIMKENNYYDFIKLFPFKILNAREVRVIKNFVTWWCNIIEEDLK